MDARIRALTQLDDRWGLDVPVRWRHPDGWRATVQAASALADTYGVDYASRRGARRSNHYDGKAIDLWAVDLPRALQLVAPDGARRRFDLSAPDQTRDLSLTPALIDWIEAHFKMKKLRSDYRTGMLVDHENPLSRRFILCEELSHATHMYHSCNQ